jgi:hypothetical protein
MLPRDRKQFPGGAQAQERFLLPRIFTLDAVEAFIHKCPRLARSRGPISGRVHAAAEMLIWLKA